MKKAAGIILKVLLGIIILILVLLFTVPILFKDKIRVKVEEVIAGSVNATVKFDDYKLGFFKDFPNLSFSLNGVSVVGMNEFENDTLAGFKSFNFVFNLSSLFKDTGYEVKSIIVDRAVINAIVLKDGKANWDIMKDTTQTPETEVADTSSSNMKILLKKVAILNSSISYIDESSAMKVYIKNSNFNLKGGAFRQRWQRALTQVALLELAPRPAPAGLVATGRPADRYGERLHRAHVVGVGRRRPDASPQVQRSLGVTPVRAVPGEPVDRGSPRRLGAHGRPQARLGVLDAALALGQHGRQPVRHGLVPGARRRSQQSRYERRRALDLLRVVLSADQLVGDDLEQRRVVEELQRAPGGGRIQSLRVERIQHLHHVT